MLLLCMYEVGEERFLDAVVSLRGGHCMFLILIMALHTAVSRCRWRHKRRLTRRLVFSFSSSTFELAFFFSRNVFGR